MLNPSSVRSERIHTTCQEQSDRAMYSASVDESVTVFCLRLNQEMGPWANLIKYPVIDRHMIGSDAQSESEKAVIPSPFDPSNTSP